jgi:hypothetical protein
LPLFVLLRPPMFIRRRPAFRKLASQMRQLSDLSCMPQLPEDRNTASDRLSPKEHS